MISPRWRLLVTDVRTSFPTVRHVILVVVGPAQSTRAAAPRATPNAEKVVAFAPPRPAEGRGQQRVAAPPPPLCTAIVFVKRAPCRSLHRLPGAGPVPRTPTGASMSRCRSEGGPYTAGSLRNSGPPSGFDLFD